jgi:DNA-binding response OmpR family regulator
MKRIIIVDDDKDLREMLRLRLEFEGYEVRVAANGLRLLSSLRVDPPDLIILDVLMSWIDGFELCQALRKNPEFANIPVFILSALASEEDRRQGEAAGCTRYHTKPVDLDLLLRDIREALARSVAEGG